MEEVYIRGRVRKGGKHSLVVNIDKKDVLIHGFKVGDILQMKIIAHYKSPKVDVPNVPEAHFFQKDNSKFPFEEPQESKFKFNVK